MIALLVTIETREPGPLPIRSSEAVSASSSAAAGGGDLLGGCAPLDQQDEPVVLALPVPEQLLDPLEERRPETAQPLLWPELEDAVRLQARLLRASPLAGGRSRLNTVERRRDHVEVGGLGGLPPFLGEGRVDQLQRLVGGGAHLLGICDRSPRGSRRRAHLPSRASATPSRRVAAASRRQQASARGL